MICKIRGYDDREDAISDAVRRIQTTRAKVTCYINYRCDTCGLWHLTRNEREAL